MPSPESPRPTAADAPSTPEAGCCGGPAPHGADACCVRDAEVKTAGGAGCGCGTPARTPAAPARSRSSCC
jgi:hypothetical protein